MPVSSARFINNRFHNVIIKERKKEWIEAIKTIIWLHNNGTSLFGTFKNKGSRSGGGGGGHTYTSRAICVQANIKYTNITTKKRYTGRLGKGKTERRIKYVMRKTDREQLVSHWGHHTALNLRIYNNANLKLSRYYFYATFAGYNDRVEITQQFCSLLDWWISDYCSRSMHVREQLP